MRAAEPEVAWKREVRRVKGTGVLEARLVLFDAAKEIRTGMVWVELPNSRRGCSAVMRSWAGGFVGDTEAVEAKGEAQVARETTALRATAGTRRRRADAGRRLFVFSKSGRRLPHSKN